MFREVSTPEEGKAAIHKDIDDLWEIIKDGVTWHVRDIDYDIDRYVDYYHKDASNPGVHLIDYNDRFEIWLMFINLGWSADKQTMVDRALINYQNSFSIEIRDNKQKKLLKGEPFVSMSIAEIAEYMYNPEEYRTSKDSIGQIKSDIMYIFNGVKSIGKTYTTQQEIESRLDEYISKERSEYTKNTEQELFTTTTGMKVMIHYIGKAKIREIEHTVINWDDTYVLRVFDENNMKYLKQCGDKDEIISRLCQHERIIVDKEYVLTEQGKAVVEKFIRECEAKRKEILNAGKDTALETEIPTIEDILSDINCGVGVDEQGDYYNSWGVTDNYNSDTLGLTFGKDFFIKI